MSETTEEKCYELNEFGNDEEYDTEFEGREFDSNGSPKVIEITSSLPNEAVEFLLGMEENGGVDENSVEMEFEPFVGQCFLSEEEAFAFYQNYAKRNGFSIRKGRTDKKRGEVTRRDFFCHRHGRPPLKVPEVFKKQRNRKSAKCECTAHLRISLRKSFDIFPLEWQVDIAIEDNEQTQSHNTMLGIYKSSLRMMSPLEEQAHNVLTPYAFKLFQKEFGLALQYAILHESEFQFLVQYHKETSITQKHVVFWDGNLATCTCKQFEFRGILCQHVISVFLHKDCYEIPSMYLPSRWRREASQTEEIPDVWEEHVLNEDSLLESSSMFLEDKKISASDKKISACKNEPQNALVPVERIENSIEYASESTDSQSMDAQPIVCSGIKSESTAILESSRLNTGPSFAEYFPNYPTPDPTWCGSFEVLDSVSRSEFFDGFQAHAPGKLQHKALEFSKQMPGVLLCTLLPSSDVWVDVFHDKCPNMEDVALYFFPGSFERSKQKYIRLLGHMEVQDLVLKSCIDGVELLIFSSTKLHAESSGSKLNFLWGVCRCLRSSMTFSLLPFNDIKSQECAQNFDVKTSVKKYLSNVKTEKFDGIDIMFSKNPGGDAALQST
ncbi:hypothetical protein REPUB_Repub08aG0059100 [Reevesia pubescens]